MPASIPGWVTDAVFYQIFPDRFARSDRLAKPDTLEAWGSPPTVFGFQGGDLFGVDRTPRLCGRPRDQRAVSQPDFFLGGKPPLPYL